MGLRDSCAVKENITDVQQNTEESKGDGNSQSKKLKQWRMAKRLAVNSCIIVLFLRWDCLGI